MVRMADFPHSPPFIPPIIPPLLPPPIPMDNTEQEPFPYPPPLPFPPSLRHGPYPIKDGVGERWNGYWMAMAIGWRLDGRRTPPPVPSEPSARPYPIIPPHQRWGPMGWDGGL